MGRDSCACSEHAEEHQHENEREGNAEKPEDDGHESLLNEEVEGMTQRYLASNPPIVRRPVHVL